MLLFTVFLFTKEFYFSSSSSVFLWQPIYWPLASEKDPLTLVLPLSGELSSVSGTVSGTVSKTGIFMSTPLRGPGGGDSLPGSSIGVAVTRIVEGVVVLVLVMTSPSSGGGGDWVVVVVLGVWGVWDV